MNKILLIYFFASTIALTVLAVNEKADSGSQHRVSNVRKYNERNQGKPSENSRGSYSYGFSITSTPKPFTEIRGSSGYPATGTNTHRTHSPYFNGRSGYPTTGTNTQRTHSPNLNGRPSQWVRSARINPSYSATETNTQWRQSTNLNGRPSQWVRSARINPSYSATETNTQWRQSMNLNGRPSQWVRSARINPSYSPTGTNTQWRQSPNFIGSPGYLATAMNTRIPPTNGPGSYGHGFA